VRLDVEGFSWRFWLVAQIGQDGYTELGQSSNGRPTTQKATQIGYLPLAYPS
jgi:hypothetical protein